MGSLSDKSSRRLSAGGSSVDASPMRVILSHDDPAQMADSRTSTVELQQADLQRGRGSSAGAALLPEERTVISKRAPAEDLPIHIGPLDSRRSLEGESLDHFRLEQYVGGGGMGAVYRAFDTTLNRVVAVKILSRDQSDSETVRRFRNEAQSSARLDHPNIARVYYVGEDKGWNFIVFEFIEGVNLREVVERQGPLPLEEALNYTLQVAQALEHASQRDVVHRDIKPSNVLLARGGIKLVDMGLARLHQVESSSDDLTASGVTLGTFDYISPEQARDPRTADSRSDIYSLGCTLYFMIVGRPPFPEGTALQKLLRHNGDDPPDVRLFRPDTPEPVVSLLDRMLAKKREHRYQTPGELIDAIERLAHRLQWRMGGGSSVVRLPQKESNTTAPSNNYATYLPWAVAIAVLLGVAFLPENFMSAPAPLPTLPNWGEVKPLLASVGPVAEKNTTSDKNTPPRAIASPTVEPKTEVAKPDKIETHPAEKTAVAVAPTTNAGETKTPGEASPPMAAGSNVPSNSVPTTESSNPAVVPATTKRRIVVRLDADPKATPEEGVLSVALVTEAFRLLDRSPDIDLVELEFNGRHLVEAPLAFPARKITFRAAAGFTPELVFRPSPDAASGERLAVHVPPGAGLTWEKIRLRWELPASSSEWSCFRLEGRSALEFNDCVVTLVNSENGSRLASQATVFEVAAEPLETADEAIPESVQLTVRRTILRGDAGIIRVTEDYPFRGIFADSFVASPHHLLETGGLHAKPLWMDRVRLSIENCTLAVGQGLVLSGSRFDAPYRMEVRVDAENSVIVSDRPNAIFEYRGGDVNEEARLSFDGEGNFYPRSLVFFRRVMRQEGEETSFDAALGDLPRWAHDRNSEQGVLETPTTNSASHDQTPADYLLAAPHDGAGAGRVPLPTLETGTARTMKGATNMGGVKPESSSATLSPEMMEPTGRPTTP